MKLYHGTTEEVWEKIKKEGVLWGNRTAIGYNPDRCTYLTTLLEEAEMYGPIILQIERDPKHEGTNNYYDGCWQFREYSPISLDRISMKKRRIRKRENISSRIFFKEKTS